VIPFIIGMRSAARFCILIVFVFGGASAAIATDYYISSSLGNDSWSGSLPTPNGSGTDGPKASLDAAQTLLEETVGPGDRVLFRRDNVFESGLTLRNATGTPDNWITIGVYGEGEKPIFNKTGTGRVIFLRGDSSAAASYLKFENLVFTTSGEPGARPVGVYINETYWPNVPHHITFDGCEIIGCIEGINVYAENVVFENGLIKDNFKIEPAEDGHSSGAFIQADNARFSNNIFENNGKHDSWFDWQTYISHCDGAVYENNILRNGLDGLKLRGVTNVIVRGNVIHGMNLAGISLGGDISTGASNIIVEKNLIYDTVDGITVKDQSGGGDIGANGVTIRNNILHSNRTVSDFMDNAYQAYIFIGGAPVTDVLILNNLVYGVTHKSNLYFKNTTPSGSAVKNNVWSRTVADDDLVRYSAGALSIITVDNNLYDFPTVSGTLIEVDGTRYDTLSSFRDDYSEHEQNSLEGSPELQDPGTGDFTPTPDSSLVIDTGSAVPGIVDDDFSNNFRPVDGDASGTAEWDIGPYEYGIYSGGEPQKPSGIRVGD
jgi:hypothetical protein